MSHEKHRELLENVAAQAIATDGADRDTLIRMGTALEEVIGGEQATGAAVEAVSAALQVLQGVYTGAIADGTSAMEAVATAVAAAAQGLADPAGGAMDLGLATKGLRELVKVAAGPPVAPGEVPGTPVREEVPGTQIAGLRETGKGAVTRFRVNDDADPGLLGEYVTECLDHIVAAEAALLDPEANPDNAEQINRIFRAFHTIKGTSGFLGLEAIQRLAHLGENLLDRAREGQIRVLGGYADLALRSCDSLRAMIEALRGAEAGSEIPVSEGYGELMAVLADPEAAGVDEGTEVDAPRLGELLVGKGKVDREQVEQAAEEQGTNRLGEALMREGKVAAADVGDALRTQRQMTGQQGEATVRVGTGRLDSLIDMVGELVIAQSMVSQDPVATDTAHPRLSRNVSHVGKIVRELQDLTMSLRMVPLKATFQKMARLVRDLARKADKKVRFVTQGEDTEIDRNMVEALGDPLVHMMRNAVDHGIDPEADRAAAGRTPWARWSCERSSRRETW